MEIKLRAGMRVLYKQGSNNWLVGTVYKGKAEINEQGLWIPIIPKGATWEEQIDYAEINNIFTDATEVEDWMKYSLISKEDYIKIIQEEDFHKSTEAAWVSDGEYYYYPVSKFNENWIMKQPFNYILRSN